MHHQLGVGCWKPSLSSPKVWKYKIEVDKLCIFLNSQILTQYAGQVFAKWSYSLFQMNPKPWYRKQVENNHIRTLLIVNCVCNGQKKPATIQPKCSFFIAPIAQIEPCSQKIRRFGLHLYSRAEYRFGDFLISKKKKTFYSCQEHSCRSGWIFDKGEIAGRNEMIKYSAFVYTGI